MTKRTILPYSERKRNSLSRDEYLSIERDFHDQLATHFNWDEPISTNFSYDRGEYGAETEACFERLLGDVKGKKILDIGSGYGNTALNLALRGAEVSSIDIAPKLIEGCQYRARRNNLKIDFREMDASNITFPETYFDIIVGFRTIHHLPDLNKFCYGARKCLKVNGFLLIVEPQKHNPLVEFGRYFIKNDENSRTPTEHPLVTKDIELIRQTFGNLEKWEFEFLKPASLIFSILRINALLKASARMLGVIDKALVRIPFLRPLYWQVVIKSIKQE